MFRKSSMRWKVFGVSKMMILVAFALLWGAGAVAQNPPVPASEATGTDAADALSCWWKADKSSVRIGEEFTVTLTCRLVETGRETTVINESLIDPNVLALPPYQVKNGRRYKDIIRVLPGPDGSVTLRYVQYTYDAKLMGEGFFGKDLPLPSLEIRYHVDLATNKDVVTPGKERTYILSPLPMRIQSLVPRDADTIRDTGNETFGDIEGHRKKMVIAFIAAGIFLLFALAVTLPILVRVVRSRRVNVFNGTGFHDRALLTRLVREMERIEKMRRISPWDDVSIGKVLSVFRIGGSLALARRIIQTPVEVESCGREGQLELSKGFWPPTKVLVSASLTPEEMADEMTGANRQGAAAARHKALLAETQKAFAAFNVVHYATPGNTAGRETLDGALNTGLKLLRALQHDHFLPVHAMRAAGERWARWRRQWRRS
jgi:hypothetical protein